MKKPLLFSVVFFVLATIGAIIFFYTNLSPISHDAAVKEFVINQGDSTSLIGQRLVKAGLIKNDQVFLIYSYYLGLNSKLQAGTFRLSSSMSLVDIINKLSKSGSYDYWLKILPGQRIEEIASKLSNPDQFLLKNKSSEGYLYPDSYLVPKDFTPEQILELTKVNFDKQIKEASADNANNRMDQKDIVIFASILEREARTVESKRRVAGVLLNRISVGIPLQVDASIQYAVDSFGYKKLKDWTRYEFWQPVTADQLDVVSPYNTYQNQGLPPGPICNPGYDSLYAAYHPVESDYLYYITGTDNEMHYAKTLDEHNANITKYLK